MIYDRRIFIQKFLNYFNKDLSPLTNGGYLSLIVFKDHAMVVVIDAKDKDKEDLLEGVGHIIAKEYKEIDLEKDTFTTHIDMDRTMNQVSPTLQRILKIYLPFSVIPFSLLQHILIWIKPWIKSLPYCKEYWKYISLCL